MDYRNEETLLTKKLNNLHNDLVKLMEGKSILPTNKSNIVVEEHGKMEKMMENENIMDNIINTDENVIHTDENEIKSNTCIII